MAIQNLITEQFLTIQGEGRSIGQLAYFIRLAGCNLYCKWCDSMHSVDPNLFKDNTFPIDYSKIPANCKLLVITGGEPCLFNLEEIYNFTKKSHPDIRFEIESNATLFPNTNKDLFFWNLSPKLTSSSQKYKFQDEIRLSQLKNWVQYCSSSNLNNVIFKFVITSNKDLNEVLHIASHYKIPNHLIYLMAEGDSSESQSIQKVEYILNFAKDNGFNFSPRLHILFWEKTRGV